MFSEFHIAMLVHQVTIAGVERRRKLERDAHAARLPLRSSTHRFDTPMQHLAAGIVRRVRLSSHPLPKRASRSGKPASVVHTRPTQHWKTNFG
jgi:hypothetical protein